MSDPIKLGSRWRNRKTGREYRITRHRLFSGMVYLACDTKGGRSRWKHPVDLVFDYELLPETAETAGK